ncbi:MAG: Muramidase (flagellum-specific) [Myxococcaceae bacterium]|nr:Muramidase (flagellum-specific) [Myxococcaceae bacterium]
MAERENSSGKGKLLDLDGGDPKKRPTGAHPVASAPGRSTGLHPAASAPTSGKTGTNPAFAPLAPSKTGSHPAARPLPPSSKTGSHPAARPLPTASLPAVTGPASSAPREPTPFQKAQLSSAFQGAREAQSKAVLARTLGKTAAPLFSDDEDEATAIGVAYDGENPAKELVNRDLWKAVQAPVQSREGRRSAELYQTVINQFAVGKNPRYENDAPDKPRGHIFVWDVSRAMNCEIPHFAGAKELSLGQTVDWLRHEGPMRGWTRASVEDAHQQAQAGMLAVAIPRDLKIKQLAVLLPDEETSPDGKPYAAAAGKVRGNRVKLTDALGVFAIDCFVHL